MSEPEPSVLETRRHQMFPTLQPAEIGRLRRFGEARSFVAGDALAKVGVVSPGLMVILAGAVDVSRHSEMGGPELIVTYRVGSFMGELAQLSGRPSLVDSRAIEPVEALVIAPDRLRAVLVAEAELGERIMRALILRRVGLLEAGAGGPVIIGPPGSVPDVFAIGDVRAGSVKRVAASVGEGAQVVAALHGFLSPANGAARQSVRR